VSCPVALYSAKHDRNTIRFNMINPETGNRIRMVTQDAETGEPVERSQTVKGFSSRRITTCSSPTRISTPSRSRAPW
jgi:DNA end-binding protein Ku